MSSRRRPYVESPVIMSTVRLVTPFVLTFGLFVTLHGASSPGGGFQGGVIVASVIVMLSFAYGIDLTWEWLDKRVLVGITAGGVALFGGIALGTVLLGGQFLELAVYPVEDAVKYGIELVEVGIAMIVTGVITSLFFTLARGAMPPADESETDVGTDTDTGDGTGTEGANGNRGGNGDGKTAATDGGDRSVSPADSTDGGENA